MVNSIETIQEPLLPLEVHIFERDGRFYAMDAKSLSVFALSQVAADVLRLLPTLSVDEIAEALSDKHTADQILRVYKSFVRLILDGHLQVDDVPRPEIPGLQNLVIMLAGGCNMGCTYCFERDVPSFQAPNLLTEKAADEILNWFMTHHKGRYAHVEFYGGEPTLNWKMLPYALEKLEEWAARTGKTLTRYIITNGTLLTDERIQYLKDHNVDIQISLDGSAKTNQFRTLKNGRSTHDKVVETIDRLNANEARYNVRGVLTNNAPDPERIVKELEQIGAKRISFGAVSSDLKQFKWNSDQENELLANYASHLSTRTRTGVERELPANVQAIVRRLRRKERIHYACHAGTTEVTVSPDGSIYECQRLMGKPLGHVSDGASLEAMKSTFLKTVDAKTPCRTCFARYLCGGGCKESNVQHNGEDRPWPVYCEMKRMEVEAAVVFAAKAQRACEEGSSA